MKQQLTIALACLFFTLSSHAQCFDYTKIFAKDDHAFGIKSDSSLWAWGNNIYSQLNGSGTVEIYTPVQLPGSWITIYPGDRHSFGVKSDGSLWAWGDNFYGQIGDGTRFGSKSVPVPVAGSWLVISAGSDYTLGIKTDGTLWGWGRNDFGQLGDGTNVDKIIPTQVPGKWLSVSAGSQNSYGIKSDGTLWSWGYNYYGQLGDGTTVEKHAPVSLGGNWLYVTAGFSNVVAKKSDGTTWGWGANFFGQLGEGSTTDRHTPVQIPGNWLSVSPGVYHTVGIKSDNSLWAWGNNDQGELGDGTTVSKITPVPIGGKWKTAFGLSFYSVGLKTDSSLFAWGAGQFGELGNGTRLDKDVPTLIYSCASAAGTGLQGIYYSGTTLTGVPLLNRIDTTINFELTYSKIPQVLSPAPGVVPEDKYSVRWSGQVLAQYSETYTFYTVSDDGIRLWVNGVQLVDDWMNQDATEKSGTITLTAGQKYDIRIEYYENTGNAVTKLLWSSPSTPKKIIPKQQLFPPAIIPGTGSGLRGNYYNGITLAGAPLLTRIDPTINFNFSYGNIPQILSPAPGTVPEDKYSVRWTGSVQPLYSETYTFYTVSDDGIRLWVNGIQLVDNWMTQDATEKSGSITLVAGQKYDIVIEYYENTGNAVTKLLWSGPSTPKAIIPQTQLYPPAGMGAVANARVVDNSIGMVAQPGMSGFYNLSPNPVRPGNLVKIDINSDKAERTVLNVSGINGQTISTRSVNLVPGVNTISINTSGFGKGLYIIHLAGGSKAFNKKLIVQ